MVEQKFLIKCECEECRCENATTDGVCYECEKGLHVRDREMEMEPSKSGMDLNDETATE